jgi:hypothetical protein
MRASTVITDPRVLAASRVRLALDMFVTAEAVQAQNLKRRYPDASEQELRTRLGEWLLARPGAEDGDAAGRRTGWPRQRR